MILFPTFCFIEFLCLFFYQKIQGDAKHYLSSVQDNIHMQLSPLPVGPRNYLCPASILTPESLEDEKGERERGDLRI